MTTPPRAAAARPAGTPRRRARALRRRAGLALLLPLLGVTAAGQLPQLPALAQLAGGGRAATPIEVRGTRAISSAQALALLGDRLAFARSRPPTPALADDAAFMLRELLENNGFSAPRVTPSIRGGRIILDVVEGPRLHLGTVAIPGQPKDEARRLGLLFGSVGEARKLAGETRVPFRDADLEEALGLVRADFESRGHWAAEVALSGRATGASGAVDVELRVDPGPLHTIRAARFTGETGGLGGELRRAAGAFTGRPATTANINGLRSAVESLYQERGYPNAAVRMAVAIEGGGVTPEFGVDPGRQYRLGELQVVGLERTRPEGIARFTEGLVAGDVYDETEVERRIKGLLGTGAFAAVRMETAARGSVLDATLRVTEGKARGASFYGGFGTYEGPIFGARYYDRNLGGRLWNLTGGLEASNRTLLGELRLSDPWLDAAGSWLGGRVFALGRSHEGYDKVETGAGVEYTRMLAENAPLEVSLASSYVDIESTGIPVGDLGDTHYLHTRLRVTQGYDRRDDPLAPSRGWRVAGWLEAGTTEGGEQAGYLAAEAAASWHTTVDDDHHLSLGLRAGQLLAGGSELPIDLRFFTGGADSVRSFRERELGPRTLHNYPRGGEAYWVFNSEYVHQLAGSLYGVVFVDAGSLSGELSDLGFDDPEVAAGLGLRLDLPIGPVRLEYGRNLTKDRGETSGTFHFAIGVAF